jgi:hypothetical protein
MSGATVAITAAFVMVLVAGFSLSKPLSLEDRVRAQEAIERVYYAHQAGATRPFEDAVPRGAPEAKVLKSLGQTALLERV